jgi:hypothetical protein
MDGKYILPFAKKETGSKNFDSRDSLRREKISAGASGRFREFLFGRKYKLGHHFLVQSSGTGYHGRSRKAAIAVLQPLLQRRVAKRFHHFVPCSNFRLAGEA